MRHDRISLIIMLYYYILYYPTNFASLLYILRWSWSFFHHAVSTFLTATAKMSRDLKTIIEITYPDNDVSVIVIVHLFVLYNNININININIKF